MKSYIVYIKINESGYITAVNSSAFLSDTTSWILIDEGAGDKYHHAQGNYFDKPLMTDSGAYRYKLEDGVPVECSAAEIAEQEAAFTKTSLPTPTDRIAALEAAMLELILGGADI